MDHGVNAHLSSLQRKTWQAAHGILRVELRRRTNAILHDGRASFTYEETVHLVPPCLKPGIRYQVGSQLSPNSVD